jgi:hypothetical protein
MSVWPIIDAGPGLNFLSSNKERLLISVIGRFSVAGKAKAELQRRGQHPSARRAPEPQDMATWWQEFQAHADAVERAIGREHQAAICEGRPWPPWLTGSCRD